MTAGMIAVIVIVVYLALLLGLGVISNRFFRGTAADYFLASRGIGSFLLLMSLFGTTMTGFALIGSTGEAYASGISVYGQMVSWSGLLHSFCFFVVGIRLWSWGKRFNYTTQIQFFRDRFESNGLGLVLFPALVGLVIPYLLVGVIGGGSVIEAITRGAFPNIFTATSGGIPFWLGSLVICLVVLTYVFFGGVRGTAWANAFQTIVFVVLGMLTFMLIANKLGGPAQATANVVEYNPAHLKLLKSDEDQTNYRDKLAAFEAQQSPIKPKQPKAIPPLVFFTYMFIPLSVAMFPHLFQHWLTAKSASTFKLSVVAHPLLMMFVWASCVLIGVWATSAVVDGVALLPQDPGPASPNLVLPLMVKSLKMPILGGLISAGVLAAIMSSLDSQFLCLGSIFTNDILAHYLRHDRLSDRQRVLFGRVFVIVIVAITYALAVLIPGRSVFTLGIWCFTGFASLSPLVFAAIYWKRASKAGAYACVIVAAVVGLWLFKLSNFGADRDYVFVIPGTDWGVMPVAVNFLAAAAAMIIVSLISPAPSQATVEKFFGRKAHAA